MIISPLTLSELTQIFNKDAQSVISYFIFKAVISQPELIKGQDANPIQIPKEHIEQWGVQALGLNSIGAGSYPIDLIEKNQKYGADIKMLSWGGSKKQSGETSLGQKFVDSNLDKLFLEKRHDDIVRAWVKILDDKFNILFKNHPNLTNIYYFIFIRDGKKFHICGMKVDTSNFSSMITGKTSKDSVWVNNFIDNKYGQIKIYKAKKRMELRLLPHQWIEDNLVITFDIKDYKISSRDIINLSVSQRYEFYKDDFIKLFNAYCNYTKDE